MQPSTAWTPFVVGSNETQNETQLVHAVVHRISVEQCVTRSGHLPFSW